MTYYLFLLLILSLAITVINKKYFSFYYQILHIMKDFAKLLEIFVVYIIGIKKEDRICTPAGVYAGGSGTRVLLYIFHEKSFKHKGC